MAPSVIPTLTANRMSEPVLALGFVAYQMVKVHMVACSHFIGIRMGLIVTDIT